MNSTVSPNMSLIIPTAGQDPGPQYALDINSSLTLIDQHNHSPGSGVQITPAGISITANLPFQNHAATGLSYLSLTAAGSASSVIQSISSAAASSINELWYTDSNGVSTQLTSNGTVNATIATPVGITTTASGFQFNKVTGGVATTVPAVMDVGSVIVRPTTAGTTNGITLISPAVVGNLTLPAQPSGSTKILQMTTAGVVTAAITVDG